MELGLDLEDDTLFDLSKQRCKEICREPYAVKNCPPRWFNGLNTLAISKTDEQTVMKYRGDEAYLEGKFDTALDFYQQCQYLLQPNNITMRRGIEEDKSRCHLKLHKIDEALNSAKKVAEMAQNFDQMTSALMLLLDIYNTAGYHKGMVYTLIKQLLLHPNNSSFWMQLGHLYSSKYNYNRQYTTANVRTSCSDRNDSVSQFINLSNSVICNNSEQYVKHMNLNTSSEEMEENMSLHKSDDYSKNLSSIDVTSRRSHDHETHDDESMNDAIELIDFNSILEEDSLQILASNTDFKHELALSMNEDTTHMIAASLTCYMAARLLLRSVERQIGSFAKKKNICQQMEIKRKIELLTAELPNMVEVSTKCCKFLKSALNLEFNTDMNSFNDEISSDADELSLRRILHEDEKIERKFKNKWFSWQKANYNL